jgi:periplasmic copper chaperone A
MRVSPKFAFAVVCAAAGPLAAAAPCWAQTSKNIEVQQPWSPATPGGARTAAAYMILKNDGATADSLIGGSTPIAQAVQVHVMSISNGVMRMRELPQGLAVPAHGSAALKPGAYHLMLVGVKKRLKAGETFPLTLRFQKAGEIAVQVPVEPIGSTGPTPAGGMQTDKMNMQ